MPCAGNMPSADQASFLFLERSVNRRSLLTTALLALASRHLPLPAWTQSAAASPMWRHGTSPFGPLKYPAGFARFDYVNADAPKGGTVRQIALGTFDNFNMTVSGVKGLLAAGIDLTHSTLTTTALDEVSSEYMLVAEAVLYPDDFSSVSYRLREQARWHDGKPITVDDVIFSFLALKKYSPQAAADYRHVVKAEKSGDREVTFTFDGAGYRKLPQILGRMKVFPKHYWEGADKDGKPRDIGATTLEPPLGSGPYRIKAFEPGRSIIYERVKDYWAKDLNVNVGRDNFDELRYDYFRDLTSAIESFKADGFDWRIENGAKNWATAYDFPAVKDKRVLLEEFPVNSIGVMQAFAFNTRREKFNDPRVRLAFNCAFDFEQMNKQLFYGQYKRISSYFEGTELAATGLPAGRELELLETVRDAVPADLFKKPYANPWGHQSDMRTNLREADRLLREAGYEVRDQQRIHAKTGEPFTIEFLNNGPFERIFLFYKPSLERLGISVSVRTVDHAQYENRMRSWDFDIVTFAWGQSLLPGAELRGYFGSQAAEQPGSLNVTGIKNPAVDTMIRHVVSADSYAELVAAAKALDRVLLWNHYVVPQWTYNKLRTARWDRFGRPDPLPKYGVSAFPALWWLDAEKATKTGSRQ
jgi:microcin C transport system substrate-binding protein